MAVLKRFLSFQDVANSGVRSQQLGLAVFAASNVCDSDAAQLLDDLKASQRLTA